MNDQNNDMTMEQPTKKPKKKKILIGCLATFIGYHLLLFLIIGISLITGNQQREEDIFNFKLTDSGDSYYVHGVYNDIEYKHLTVPESYEGKPVVSVYLNNYASVESITLPNSVEEFEFKNCINLKSVKVPDSVVEISPRAFEKCYSLTEVTLPNGLKEIGDFAFADCKSLTGLYIPSNVIMLGKGMISGCSSLVSLEVALDNSTYQGKNNCIISVYNNENNKTGKVVLGCNGSEIPTDENIVSIGDYAFYGCTGLTNLNIPSSVVALGKGSFAYCTGLTSFDIPYGVKRLEGRVFEGCTSLTTVFIPSTVEYIEGGGVFANCTSLMNYHVSPENDHFYAKSNCLLTKGTDCALIAGNNQGLIPTDGGIKTIVASAFEGRTGITEIILPAGVNNIQDSVFSGCTGLKSVVIPSTIEYIGTGVFASCDQLSHIYIQKTGLMGRWHDKTILEGSKVYYSDKWDFVDGKPVLK